MIKNLKIFDSMKNESINDMKLVSRIKSNKLIQKIISVIGAVSISVNLAGCLSNNDKTELETTSQNGVVEYVDKDLTLHLFDKEENTNMEYITIMNDKPTNDGALGTYKPVSSLKIINKTNNELVPRIDGISYDNMSKPISTLADLTLYIDDDDKLFVKLDDEFISLDDEKLVFIIGETLYSASVFELSDENKQIITGENNTKEESNTENKEESKVEKGTLDDGRILTVEEFENFYEEVKNKLNQVAYAKDNNIIRFNYDPAQLRAYLIFVNSAKFLRTNKEFLKEELGEQYLINFQVAHANFDGDIDQYNTDCYNATGKTDNMIFSSMFVYDEKERELAEKNGKATIEAGYSDNLNDAIVDVYENTCQNSEEYSKISNAVRYTGRTERYILRHLLVGNRFDSLNEDAKNDLMYLCYQDETEIKKGDPKYVELNGIHMIYNKVKDSIIPFFAPDSTKTEEPRCAVNNQTVFNQTKNKPLRRVLTLSDHI